MRIQRFSSVPPVRAKKGQLVALDLELMGLDPNRLHRPGGSLAVAGISLDGKKVYQVFTPDDLRRAWDRIHNGTIVMHNAHFDISHMRRWVSFRPQQIIDTLLLERILWSGWYSDFGLAHLARRYLREIISKEVRELFLTNKVEVTPEMLDYNARDVCITYAVAREQLKLFETKENADLWKVWTEFDEPALWAVLDFKGMRIDEKRWKSMAIEYQNKADVIVDKLGFNPGSPKQVMEFLSGKGIYVRSTSADVLREYCDDAEIELILQYREAKKRASTYGLGFLEKYLEEDSRIYPAYRVTGAETGRMSSSPNAQNFPHEAEYRQCFVPGPGNVLVDGDWSTQEPRCMAEMSQDSALLEVFRKGEDLHLTVAKEVLENPNLTKADKDERREGKIVGLAALYGMTASGMADRTGRTVMDCNDLLTRYFNRFRGVSSHIERIRDFAREHSFVNTLSGRRVWVNPYNYQWANNAINTPIQGSAADMLKLCLSFIHKDAGEKMPVIAAVHDELLLEVPKNEGKLVAGLLTNYMRKAHEVLLPSVSTKNCADVAVCNSWADKK